MNIIQNRNLHSARDLSLLIKQLNEEIGGKVNEVVEASEYDQIFKRVNVGQVSIMPRLENLLESVAVTTLGPSISMDLFTSVCATRGLPSIPQRNELFEEWERRSSTGVRLTVKREALDGLWDEVEIPDEVRSAGVGRVQKFGDDSWLLVKRSDVFWASMRAVDVTLSELEDHNDRIRKRNAKIESENARKLAKARVCEFVLSAINFSVPVSIVDDWWGATKSDPSLIIQISLLEQIQIEQRIEAITAKIHNSALSVRSDGGLLWNDQIVVILSPEGKRAIMAEFVDGKNGPLSSFRIEDLLNILFELGILTSSASLRRKRI